MNVNSSYPNVHSYDDPIFTALTDYESKPTQQAAFLKCKTDIDNLTSINGISIAEIEKRAYPQTKFNPYGFSFSGFLGAGESFKEVLRKDWDTVEALGVTHIELSRHLRNIIDIAQKAPRQDYYSVCIEYNPADLEDNTICTKTPQNLRVCLLSTRGTQVNLFDPNPGSKEPLEIDTPKNWNEEWIVENITNKVWFCLNSGVLSYIRELGFYEGGGEKNRYRVDPNKVMALLTGGI